MDDKYLVVLYFGKECDIIHIGDDEAKATQEALTHASGGRIVIYKATAEVLPSQPWPIPVV